MRNLDNKNMKQGKKKVKIFKKKKKEGIDSVIERLQSSYNDIVPENISSFNDLPLSFNTQKGLRESDYTVPTEIQKQSIGYALQGSDILGAAKTGSGKTLAFLIPVLEVLFCKKWTGLDGLGALIITPTRELAYQIFETLRNVGRYHDFSAGLVIGGKDLHFEKKRMDQCNIVICTPGRLLHHMDENPLFDCVNLQILVLDEADNCLNMGFEETMNSIIANLPPNRQTLLFSATQTKSIRDLARLSLTNPKYLSVHENAEHSTPEELTQSYVVCELEDKISNLWSFIKTHTKHKILVFFATCKQVKYTFEMFCQLRPGIALLQLHGGMHQEKRMAMYRSFCSKKYAVLFATDIAARGLDFPEVNWVIQADCPEDATTYIHRVGRTARYFKGGEAVMLLLPSEKDAMLHHLTEKKVPLQEIKINPLRLQNPRVKFEAILAKKPDLKASAQRAFVTYLKSVFLMKDKKVFDIHKLNTDLYARSLGLVVSPRIRFLTKKEKTKKNGEKSMNSADNDGSNLLDSIKQEEDIDNSSDEGSDDKMDEEEEKSDQTRNLKKTSFQTFNFEGGDSDEDDDDILRIKRKDHDLEGSDDGEPLEIGPGRRKMKPVTKAALAKKALKKNIVPNRKTIFTEDGEAIENKYKQRISEAGKKYEAGGALGGIDIEEAKKILKEEDKIDKQLFREKVKAKHREERMKLKNAKKKKDSDEESEMEEGEEEDDFSGSYEGNSSGEDQESGQESSGESSQEQSENDDQSDADERDRRKFNSRNSDIRKGVKRKKEDVDDYDDHHHPGSSLMADEELALQLLKKKR